MISIPFSYPKDSNLQLLVQFDNWFSQQKNFIIRQEDSVVDESEVVNDVFVAKAGDNYYAIRYEANFLTPTLYIDKEPFVVGERLIWHDYLLVFLMMFAVLEFPRFALNSRGNGLGFLIWPLLYFPARYISLSTSPWKRPIVWGITSFLILIELVFWFQRH
jgi:hypothetical protein